MGISYSDLPPKFQEQVKIKLAIEEARRRNKNNAPMVIEPESKPSKYHAEKVEATLDDGTKHVFDSKREYKRYQHLSFLQRAGEISNLRLQVSYELIPPQKRADGKMEKACTYKADFVYKNKDGNTVVEDSKGHRTKDYIIKRKLLLYRYGITISEV